MEKPKVLYPNASPFHSLKIHPRNRPPRADLYKFNLPDRIPRFTLPLRNEDRLPILDLQALLDRVYDRAGYDVAVDYSSNPVSSLSGEEMDWLDAQLREKGLR